jgi:hypothetical protein
MAAPIPKVVSVVVIVMIVPAVAVIVMWVFSVNSH